MYQRSREGWGSDVSVSAPDPTTQEYPVLVEMGGFAMTSQGLVHSVTREDLDNVLTPTYAPEGFHG